MEHYEHFSLQDFIHDAHFIRWVKNPDADSNAYWQAVRNTYPHQSGTMDQAADLIQGFSKFYPEVPASQIELARQVIMDQISSEKQISISRKPLYLSVAASIAILIGIALWYNPTETPVHFARNILKPNLEILSSNEGKGPKTIRLDDGSSITLSPKSTVRYNMESADRRVVHLDGEAFFNVGKNPNRPFFVFTNGLTTKVLGTKFKVSAYPGGMDVKVEVTSGSVHVYRSENGAEHAESEGLTLTPNQRAVYTRKDLLLVRTLVAQPKVLITPEQLATYTYTDTPISKVFEGLEKIYGIKVIYDQEKFKNCRLNMSLSDESLFETLELIGKMVEARYNVLDGEVIFIGAGCTE
ncbi:FecR domain-containing protein [Dyadobacter sp. LHD-138]|uniref:FecR family protein n=1 Tax=Dyadobacter sp. LHD-138 TaxID=3071413 RepID=UPI0027E0AE53|nr:FecR domain-containing protein [Dyadobacter sp. LHD-138]MDQ6480659.1 FecR domain-containing protein [Dyadobacter sp. LHD-138]